MTFCPRVAVDSARYSVGAVHKRAGPETRRELALRSRESFGGKVTFRLTAGLTGFSTEHYENQTHLECFIASSFVRATGRTERHSNSARIGYFTQWICLSDLDTCTLYMNLTCVFHSDWMSSEFSKMSPNTSFYVCYSSLSFLT